MAKHTHKTQRPSNHISLQTLDDATEVELVLVNSKGEDDPLAVQAAPYPRQATQIRQGEGSQGDFRPPYHNRIQDNWSNGRGLDLFPDDRTRYNDGFRVNSEHSGQLIAGPQETYASGYRQMNQKMPGNVAGHQALSGSQRFLSISFATGSTGYNGKYIGFVVKQVGTPADALTVRLYTSALSGAVRPSSTLGDATTLAVTDGTDLSMHYVLAVGSPGALSSTTEYHVVFDGGSGATSTNHWALAYDTTGTANESSDGSSWSTSSTKPFFIIFDDVSPGSGEFFNYKQGLYYVTTPDEDEDSVLYLNGTRGVATSGSTSTIVDTNNTRVTNEFQNKILMITDGVGSDQARPWRTIASHTTTTYTFSDLWDTAPNATTEYVIIGADSWESVETFTKGAVTSVASCGEQLFFACGDDFRTYRRRYYKTAANLWATQSASESSTWNAAHLLALNSPTKACILYGTRNNGAGGREVWFGSVPSVWGSPYNSIGEIIPTDRVWDELGTVANIVSTIEDDTMQIAHNKGSFSGLMAGLALTPPVDLRFGSDLGFYMRADDAFGSGDLQIELADEYYADESKAAQALYLLRVGKYEEFLREGVGSAFQPSSVLLRKNWHTIQPDYVWQGNFDDPSMAAGAYQVDISNWSFVDKPKSYNGHRNIADEWSLLSTTAGRMFIGGTKWFNKIHFDFGGVINLVDATMTVRYFNGESFEVVNVASDTTLDTATEAHTFGKDGIISLDMPEDFTAHSLNNEGVAKYWVDLQPSANLTANIKIKVISVSDDTHYQYVDVREDLIDRLDDTFQTLKLDEDNHHLFVGFKDHPVDVLRFDLEGTLVNNEDATLLITYSRTGDFVPCAPLADGTKVDGKTLKQSGDHTFDMPSDITADSLNGTDAYWYRCVPNAELDVVNVHKLSGIDRSRSIYYDAKNLYDTESTVEGAHTRVEMDDLEGYFVGSPVPFDTITVDITSANAATAAVTVELYDGCRMTATANVDDGTMVDETKTHAQDGSITFDMADTWKISSVNGIELFWAFVKSNGDNVDFNAQEITITNSRERDTETVVDLPMARDGDNATFEHIQILNTDHLVIVSDTPFSETEFTLVANNSSGSTSVMTGEFWDGRNWTALTGFVDSTKSSDKTLSRSETVAWTMPDTWDTGNFRGVSGYAVRLILSVSTVDTLKIGQVYVKNGNVLAIDIPALVADEWAWVPIPLSSVSARPFPDLSSIKSVRIRIDSSVSSTNINFRGGIHSIVDAKTISVGTTAAITGMVAYGNIRANAWIMTEERPFEIQETDGVSVAVPMPLSELGQLQAHTNGHASAQNDVYLYFNINQHLQRFFSGSLENIGFNRDEGLPSNRQGPIADLLSYPGRIIASTNADAGWSSVLSRRGSGWHELYRAPRGMPVWSMFTQVVPGALPDRIWMCVDGMLVSLPLPSFTFNPLNDSQYTYYHETSAITGWFTFGYEDIEKLFTTIKLTTENLNGEKTNIKVQYQLDSGTLDGTWTDLPASFTVSPKQRQNIHAQYVDGTRIRFRIILNTDDATVSPVLRVFTLESIINLPVKYQYTLTFRLMDRNKDAAGSVVDGQLEADLATLKSWFDVPAVPLKLNTWLSSITGDTAPQVVIQAPGIRPLNVATRAQLERSLLRMVVLEI